MSSKIEISKKCEWCGNVFIASEIYLKKLRLENGEEIQWHRIGSTGAENINGPIDMYSIKTLSGKDVCVIYISPYQSTISQKAPKGFLIK